ncbi:MAG: prepilin-type N-terminal cleavage/methylation domain-containing protein [Candidatus Kerfeldbacteria bacterium]|nr:prepilin-type N-terminal cleavage/methylation domain-containing protein [Candidatus Kerfeldbacteria bacterium]
MKLNQAGQTLLESLIAIAIILIGLVSLIGLLISINRTTIDAIDQAKALVLAQEAVEAIHSMRDSNWLEREAGFDVDDSDGLRSGTNYTGVYVWDPTADPLSVAIIGGTDINHPTAIVYQDANGYYRQNGSSPEPSWTPTIFRRWLTLYPICLDTVTSVELIVSNNGTACSNYTSGSGPPYQEIGFQVVSTVQWTKRGTHSVTDEELLYNWKYAD